MLSVTLPAGAVVYQGIAGPQASDVDQLLAALLAVRQQDLSGTLEASQGGLQPRAHLGGGGLDRFWRCPHPQGGG